MTIQGKEFVQYPPPMRSSPITRTSKKYYLFYKVKRYETEECVLKKQMKRLIAKGYLCQFLKRDSLSIYIGTTRNQCDLG